MKISEPNDPVYWIDRLPAKVYVEGTGSHWANMCNLSVIHDWFIGLIDWTDWLMRARVIYVIIWIRIDWVCSCHLALPCLALPCLALPCLALPCLALPLLYFTSLLCHVLIFTNYRDTMVLLTTYIIVLNRVCCIRVIWWWLHWPAPLKSSPSPSFMFSLTLW